MSKYFTNDKFANELCDINKEEWIPAIKEKIAEWEEFSESIFCEEEEYKQSALNNANELREFLALVESNTLTQERFADYLFQYFY